MFKLVVQLLTMMLKPAAVIFVRNNMVLSDTFLIRSDPFINISNTWRIAKNTQNKISAIIPKMKKGKHFYAAARIILTTFVYI